MISLAKFIEDTNATGNPIRPRVVCEDGFEISVQASELHYCDPLENFRSFYKNLQLGHPSEEDPIIYEFELSSEPGIYAHVPYTIVEKLLDAHGGIAGYSR